MSDVERESYLHRVQAEAWTAIMKAYSSTGDAGQIFAAVAEVYERELRKAAEQRAVAEQGHAAIFNGAFDTRVVAYEMLDQLSSPCPEREDVQRIIAELDSVLGPDLLREADPSGEILKPLPLAERKRMLDTLDSVQKVIDERGSGQPPLIVIVEDEFPALLEAAARKRGVHVVTERDAAAERMSDYLTQLGVDPDETFEGDSRTTAQILADAALAADGPVEVGSPEHQASERLTVALMAKGDVARGEGE
jgi:hypothetical protein